MLAVSVVVDQPESQTSLTFGGSSIVGEDVASDAEEPEPDPGVGKLVAATPRNSEHLGGDVVGIGS